MEKLEIGTLVTIIEKFEGIETKKYSGVIIDVEVRDLSLHGDWDEPFYTVKCNNEEIIIVNYGRDYTKMFRSYLSYKEAMTERYIEQKGI